MSIRMAGFRITFGLFALAACGCASMTGEGRLAGPGAPRNWFARESKGAARANAPASLAKSSEPSPTTAAKPNDAKPAIVADDAQVPPKAKRPSAETVASPTKSSDETPVRNAEGEEDEDLFVLDADLGLPNSMKQSVETVASPRKMKSDEDTFELTPPPFSSPVASQTHETPSIESDLSLDEPGGEPLLSSIADGSSDDRPLMPPISRAGSPKAAAGEDPAPESRPDNWTMLNLAGPAPPPTRSETEPEKPEETHVSSGANTVVDRSETSVKEATETVMNSLPPSENIDLGPLLSALDRLSETADRPAGSIAGSNDTREGGGTDDDEIDQLLVPQPPSEVVALKPADLTAPDRDPYAGADDIARSADEFQPQSLMVQNVLFCRQIHGFGRVEPIPDDALTPGSQVLVYAEIGNFGSRIEADGSHVTELVSIATIENADETTSIPIEFEPLIDRCDSKRRDFFCHYLFRLPETLAPGEYRLRLRVKDLQRGEIGEGELAFAIGSRAK